MIGELDCGVENAIERYTRFSMSAYRKRTGQQAGAHLPLHQKSPPFRIATSKLFVSCVFIFCSGHSLRRMEAVSKPAFQTKVNSGTRIQPYFLLIEIRHSYLFSNTTNMADNFFMQKIGLPVLLLYGLPKTIVTYHTGHAAHSRRILCAAAV